MTTMNLDATLARISEIQARMVAVGVLPPARTASAASPATSFAAALSGAQGTAGVSGSQLLAGVSGGQLLAGGQLLTGGSGQAGVSGAQVVASAEKYLGVPYVFGGTSNSGLDCSGLVQKAYGDLGISLPRVAADQAHAGTAVASLDQAQPGDILAFGDPAHHVAIYLGDNMMIAAPEPGDHVKIQSVYQTPTSIRRVVGSDAAGSAALLTGGTAAGSVPAGVAQYAPLFAQNENAYQLPAGLLAAVAQTESGGNPGAVSPAGAQGLMQLMPSTARGLGVDPWNPAQAVQGAAQLLSGYLRRFGSVPLALAAYNAGPGAVEQYGGVPPYRETQNYVAKITGLLAGGAA
ncbi:MAG TPA: transglycosylase SLT domain-containing protein [Jatrophihabitans sp.]|nr:transglycosylase SLT domain-containing protein [Jatrophihabitans sp.]